MGKKALICTNATIPLPGQPVTGAGLRAWSLGEGLRHHGYDVHYAMPREALDGVEGIPAALTSYAFTEETLGESVEAANPDLLVAAQWPLLADLPEQGMPVVLDCYAPILLRTTFSKGGTEEDAAARKVAAFQKADALLLAGERQRAYVQAWQLQAGITPSEQPILIVPPALSPALPEPVEVAQEGVRVVYGGPVWLWLDPQPGLSKAVEVLRGRGTLEVCARDPGPPGEPITLWPSAARSERLRARLGTREQVQWLGLLAHDAWQEQCRGARLAFDLHQDNAERAITYPMRTIEYLWLGVPVIHSRFSPVGPLIHQYHAGWTGDPANADGLRALLTRILDAPESLARAAHNARTLAAECFTWDRATEALAAFAAQPRRRAKKTVSVASAKELAALRNELEAVQASREETEKRHAEEVQRLRAEAEEEAGKRQEAMAQFQAQLTGLVRPGAVETAPAEEAPGELIGELTSEIGALREQQTAWEQERAALEADVETLRQQASETVMEYDDALTRWKHEQGQLEEERNALRDRLEASVSKADADALRASCAEAEERYEAAQLRLAELEQVMNDTVGELNVTMAALDAAQASLNERDLEIAALKRAHESDAETRRTLEAVRDEAAQVRHELTLAQRERDVEREAAAELRAELDRLRDTDAKSEAVAADLAATKTSLEEEVSRLSEELNQASDAHASLAQALEEIEAELDRVREESAQVRRAKESAEARAAALERDMAQAGQEIERRVRGDHDWPERMEVMQAKLDRLTRELAEAQSARKTLQQELETQLAERKLLASRGGPADDAARREWAEERAALTRALENARADLADAVSAHQRDSMAWRETKQALADRLKQLIADSAHLK